MRGCRRLLTLSVTLLAGAGCREVVRQLAGGPEGAPAADALLSSLASRFGPLDRDPAYDALRPKLARAALVPSRIFDDPEAWTAQGGDWREVELFGLRNADRYRLGVRPSAPPPLRAGDYRYRLRLGRIADGRFEWRAREELALGPLRPADLARVLTALLYAGETLGAAEARLHAREAFPRASAAFSRLFVLETLDLTHGAEGATSIRVGVRVRPEGLRQVAPHYAAFLEEYSVPMLWRASASDDSGAQWWSAEAKDALLTLQLRVRDGSLVPLEGPSHRRLPDRLRLAVDYATTAGIFSVGFRGLLVDVVLTRSDREKAFSARFLEAPQWRLPFLIEPLLRGSLRYPFEDPGSEIRIGLEEGGGSTLFVGEYRFRVRESWIVRWLGGLSDRGVSDFRRGAEAEADRFNRECLLALRDDVVRLLDGTSADESKDRAGVSAGLPIAGFDRAARVLGRGLESR